jgi:hypothetical protein
MVQPVQVACHIDALCNVTDVLDDTKIQRDTALALCMPETSESILKRACSTIAAL